jgi:hypothetical protein
MPAFESLRGTCASAELPLAQLCGQRNFMVTADFATTIQQSNRSHTTDMFQRHVQWMLTRSDKHSREVNFVLIISPYEANALWPDLKNPLITLHLYKPRCNAGYAPLDRLNLFTSSTNTISPTLPRSLSVQLGLFAGQLYISTYADYIGICQFLGLSPKLVTNGLEKSPVNFFKLLMSKIRRNGDGISKTDMGGLLDGKQFHKLHWKEA